MENCLEKKRVCALTSYLVFTKKGNCNAGEIVVQEIMHMSYEGKISVLFWRATSSFNLDVDLSNLVVRLLFRYTWEMHIRN
mgnify:CR=1 FL=1